MSKKSRETFFRQLRDGSYASKQKEVYEYVWNEGPISLDSLRNGTGMAHQTLTSRLSNLMDMGVVEQDIDDNFFAAFERDWEANADNRHTEKFKKWRDRGLRDGFFNVLGVQKEALYWPVKHGIEL